MHVHNVLISPSRRELLPQTLALGFCIVSGVAEKILDDVCATLEQGNNGLIDIPTEDKEADDTTNETGCKTHFLQRRPERGKM